MRFFTVCVSIILILTVWGVSWGQEGMNLVPEGEYEMGSHTRVIHSCILPVFDYI